jgi:hypothetical protein
LKLIANGFEKTGQIEPEPIHQDCDDNHPSEQPAIKAPLNVKD